MRPWTWGRTPGAERGREGARGQAAGQAAFRGHSVAEPGQGPGQWGHLGVPDAPLTHPAKSPPGLAKDYGASRSPRARGRVQAQDTPEPWPLPAPRPRPHQAQVPGTLPRNGNNFRATQELWELRRCKGAMCQMGRMNFTPRQSDFYHVNDRGWRITSAQ